MKLSQKVAIVTGATQGIGLACAQRMISRRRQVMLVDIKAEGATAAAELGERARFFAADVSQKADVDAMVAATLAAFGRIDILINNAGVTHAANFLDVRGRFRPRAAHQPEIHVPVRPGGGARDGQAAQRLHHQYVQRERRTGDPEPGAVRGVERRDQPADQGHVAQSGIHGIRVNGIGPGTILTELAKRP
jgi:NAD(P)-dependent dehydrogenase (short-subunit alcohol dehydrogenase family)